ncbi:DnaT-like ssDNA-binding domain-containing protein [Tianweitania sp.]|uniref:DnaT-like ssDNA-binding domain-containing protein n=1 Tax=Tianweitania sp. TaxID=2021634 RepID=UPI00289E4D3A|nr:DnaT-like ssDNA-binding domain-containing protein [Tianweitania sp.]
MPSAKARRIDYSPDEYIAGVGGVLNAAEQGVYWMICSLIMSEGGAVTQNDRRFAGLCLVRPAEIRKLVDRLVEMGKLCRSSDGKLSQKRALSEVEKSLKRISTASENGSNGGRPNRKTQSNQQNPKAGGSPDEKLSLTTNYQPPTTNIEKEAPSGASKKRASRLSDDWTPSAKLIEWAQGENLPAGEVRREADKFRDHWHSSSGRNAAKLDWDKAFQNWIRNSVDGRKPRGKRADRDASGDLTNDFMFARG